MKYAFAIAVIFMLIDIEEKLKKIRNTTNEKKKNTIIIDDFLGKEVGIKLNNENISMNLNYDKLGNITGKIEQFDDKWILLSYEKKNKKIRRYLKVSDIESINEKV